MRVVQVDCNAERGLIVVRDTETGYIFDADFVGNGDEGDTAHRILPTGSGAMRADELRQRTLDWATEMGSEFGAERVEFTEITDYSLFSHACNCACGGCLGTLQI